MSQLRGLKDLIDDTVRHGTATIQQVHEEISSRPFDILERIPQLTESTKAVRVVHDALVKNGYEMVRLVSTAAGEVADVLIDHHEKRTNGSADDSRTSPESHGPENAGD